MKSAVILNSFLWLTILVIVNWFEIKEELQSSKTVLNSTLDILVGIRLRLTKV